ncbi:MAG: hypothetical protein R3D45_10840 [Rhizobiaceae bacterium]
MTSDVKRLARLAKVQAQMKQMKEMRLGEQLAALRRVEDDIDEISRLGDSGSPVAMLFPALCARRLAALEAERKAIEAQAAATLGETHVENKRLQRIEDRLVRADGARERKALEHETLERLARDG